MSNNKIVRENDYLNNENELKRRNDFINNENELKRQKKIDDNANDFINHITELKVKKLEDINRDCDVIIKYIVIICNLIGLKYVYTDRSRAIINFGYSAELGNSDAQLMLSYLYKGIDVYKSYNYFKLSLDKHNSEAQFVIGRNIINIIMNKDTLECRIYEKYYNIKVDYYTAIYYLLLSSWQHNSSALYLIGKLYYKGIILKQNYNKAFIYLQFSGDKKNKYALIYLAFMYNNGLGVKQDIQEAEIYMKLSNEQQIYNIYDFMNKYKE